MATWVLPGWARGRRSAASLPGANSTWTLEISLVALSFTRMRLIGHLSNEISARTFADYLYVQGIENQVEEQRPEGWAVWVADEDKLERATALLAAFRQNPDDPKYRAEAKGASALRAEEQKSQEAY